MEMSFLENRFTPAEAKYLNPLVLAFVGDAIYEVFVRAYLVDNHRDMHVHKLHKKAVEFVKAQAQSEFVKNIIDELTEEEIAIFKRGRNTKSATVPKNADIQDYRMATGFESLIGYLYLTEERDRLKYILNRVLDIYKQSNSQDR